MILSYCPGAMPEEDKIIYFKEKQMFQISRVTAVCGKNNCPSLL